MSDYKLTLNRKVRVLTVELTRTKSSGGEIVDLAINII